MNQMQLRSLSGWIVVDGLDVLVAQGIAQFEIYTGKPAPVHVMRKAVRQQYDLVSLVRATPLSPSTREGPTKLIRTDP